MSEARAHDAEETSFESAQTPRSSARRPSSNDEIATGLESIAALLSHDEAVRREALRRAAAVIRASSPLVPAIDEAGVEAVHALGINYALSGIVTDWVRSGRLFWLEQLHERRRAAVAALPGVGRRLAQELRDALGVVDLDGLARVAREGRLEHVLGFGPKRVKLVTDALFSRPRLPDSRQLPLLKAG